MVIPSHPADITPAWLSSVLNIDVRDVAVAPIGTGQTGATYRVSAAYATEQPELPGTFAIKLPAQDEAVRERVTIGYRSEHAFYTGVADRVKIRTPQCFHCEIANDGADFVLLLADMAPAVQGDQIGGCTPEEARLAVAALAGLHGPTWCDPAWADIPGVAMPKHDEAAANGMGEVARMAADMTLDNLGPNMSAEDRDTLCAAMALVTPWLLVEPNRFALMHGDYRWTTCCSIPTGPTSRWWTGKRWVWDCPPGIWRTSRPPACCRRPGRQSRRSSSTCTTASCWATA